MIAWCEEQVALGRVASIGTYLAQLITEDMAHQRCMKGRRAAVREARESGISMRAPDAILTVATARRMDPRVAAAKLAVEDGRLSGTSLAAIEGILARAMGVAVAA
jgi:hypothetical protein